MLRTSRLGAVLGAPLALAAGWLAYSRWGIDHALPLPPALPAAPQTYDSPTAGRIACYVDRRGTGVPLVLVHSINAGASAYEMRPLFLAYQGRRPLYAPDLPGFGLAERGDRDYTPELYAAALRDLLAQIGTPADVVALSLSSEFAARVARDHPELIRSLVLISPTGFNRVRSANRVQATAERGRSAQVRRVLLWPVWSQAIYDLLASRASIRYFLRQSFVGAVDARLVEYAYRTTHQPDARFAPFSFLSGRLFTPDAVTTLYRQVRQPALVLYDRDAFVRFDRLPELLAARPNWQALRIVPTRGLPHWEQTEAVVAALDRFWSGREHAA